MRRVGVNAKRFADAQSMDIAALLAKTKDLDYNLLEIDADSLLQVSALGRKRLSFIARNYQLDFVYTLTLAPDHDLSSSDEEVRKVGLQYVEKIIKVIGEMGGGSLNGPFYSSLPPNWALHNERALLFDSSVNSLRLLLHVAMDEDVMLNLRPVNRYEHFLLNTAGDAFQYVRTVNHPNCGIDLDTFHMNIEEDDMKQAFEQAGYYLHCLHIRENNGKCLGHGSLDWNVIKEGLDGIHYEGPIIHNATEPPLEPIPPFESKQIRSLLC